MKSYAVKLISSVLFILGLSYLWPFLLHSFESWRQPLLLGPTSFEGSLVRVIPGQGEFFLDLAQYENNLVKRFVVKSDLAVNNSLLTEDLSHDVPSLRAGEDLLILFEPRTDFPRILSLKRKSSTALGRVYGRVLSVTEKTATLEALGGNVVLQIGKKTVIGPKYRYEGEVRFPNEEKAPATDLRWNLRAGDAVEVVFISNQGEEIVAETITILN